MIICPAIKIIDTETNKELVVCGHRHPRCFDVIFELKPSWSEHQKQFIEGYIDHTGKFLDRKEAFKHARDCGQLPFSILMRCRDHKQAELYSDDLY